MILRMVVTCHRCGASVDGALTFSEQLQITDSEGFMLFGEGPVCDACLEQ